MWAVRYDRSSLISLALVAAIFSSACATQPLTSERAAPRTMQRERVMPSQPDTMRQILSGDPAAFLDIFRRMDALTLQGIVADLPQTDPTLKTSLLGSEGETTRANVLALVDTSSSLASRTEDPPARLTRFVNSLSLESLQKIALILVTLQNERDILCNQLTPRIHNIGLQSILTFEPKLADRQADRGSRAVRIPVDGRDLDPRCVRIGVLITGTVPLGVWGDSADDRVKAEYVVNKPPADRPDSFEVILLEPLINRLKSGDQVTVQVTISQLAGRPCETFGERLVAFASRTFTLYSVDDYRTKVLNARIGAHDIRAFPLPDKEIEELFGPLIAEQFYVVRLSLRNTDPEAKLVSTGMITATGRALVEAKGGGCPQPAYTLPISVVPSSLQQTFRILDDEESSQPRAWVFRSLEFAGALTTAAISAFFAPVNATKALALFTGVGIPEGKKLVPDRWPGYKSNIVAFAMPDLIKVPAASVSDHKLLFFSKKNLEG